MAFVFDLVVLVLSLIVAAVVQVAAAYGVMFGMHQGMGDKLEEKTYGGFDFDNFQKPAFAELMTKLSVIFLVPTFVLHVLFYFCFSPWGFRQYTVLLSLLLLVLEAGAIGAGFAFVLKLDKVRAGILTGASVLVYLLLYWSFLYWKLS